MLSWWQEVDKQEEQLYQQQVTIPPTLTSSLSTLSSVHPFVPGVMVGSLFYTPCVMYKRYHLAGGVPEVQSETGGPRIGHPGWRQ